MSVGLADLMKAFNTAWDASGLDAMFKALWSDPTDANFVVLHDQEASPGQLFPYCVVDQTVPRTVARMSGGVDSLREVRDVPMTLNIHVAAATGDTRSAKEIAAYLAEEVMKQFGGHPTLSATQALTLDNGHVLIMEYQTDYCIRTDDSEVQWVLSYKVRQDVPVMA